MPAPKVTKEEDIPMCIRFYRREGRDADQAAAICYSMMRKHNSKGKKDKEGMHEMPDGHMMKDSEMKGMMGGY